MADSSTEVVLKTKLGGVLRVPSTLALDAENPLKSRLREALRVSTDKSTCSGEPSTEGLSKRSTVRARLRANALVLNSRTLPAVKANCSLRSLTFWGVPGSTRTLASAQTWPPTTAWIVHVPMRPPSPVLEAGLAPA